MKRSEAPRAGWYPDPRRPQRLRWWDGSDWTDHFRPPPRDYEVAQHQRAVEATSGTPSAPLSGMHDMGGLRRADAEEIIAQVRQVARSEVDRAADVFAQRARTATAEFRPLVSEYTSKVLRWLKLIAVIVTILVVAWFVFQAVAQATFFEWLGDRIDNLTDSG